MKKELKNNDDLSMFLERRIKTEIILDDSSSQVIEDFAKSYLSRDYYKPDDNERIKKIWYKSRENADRIQCDWNNMAKTFFEENPEYFDKSNVNLFRNLKSVIESTGKYACGKAGKNRIFYYEKLQEGVVAND